MKLTGAFHIIGGSKLFDGKTVSAILLIAGSSTRLGSTVNKNFLKINNKPVFLYSLDIFNSNKYIDDIFVVIRETDKSIVQPILDEFSRKQAYFISSRR